MPRDARSLLLDAGILASAASVRIAVEQLRGLAHAASDLGVLFIPNYAWWWSAPRWLGGWNSWIFGGYPANADPQSGQLHPFGLLYAIAAPLTAAALDGALTPAAAAIGMLLYLRQIGCDRAGSLFGALSFGLGGFIAAQAPHPAHQRAALAVPWALAAIEAFDGFALVAALGAAVAAVVLSGHPQMTLYALALVVLYALGRPRRRGQAGALVLGGLLGLAVGAAVWLPTLELLQQSTQAFGGPHGGTEASGAARLVGVHLSGLVAPFAGGGGSGPLYGTSNDALSCSVTECGGYPGMLVWLVLLAGAPALLGDRRGRLWLAVAAAGLCLATGVAGVLPPVHGVRAPARFLLWWNVGAAAAAAIALPHTLRSSPAGAAQRAWVAAVLTVGVLLVASAQWGPVARRAALGAAAVLGGSALALAASRALSPPAAGALLVAALAADLLLFGLSMPTGVPPARIRGMTAVLRTLREAAKATADAGGALARGVILPFYGGANWAPFEGTRVLQGYNPLVPTTLAELLGYKPRLGAIEIGWITDPTLAAPSSHVFDLLRCRTVAVLARLRDRVGAAVEARVAAGDRRWSRLETAGNTDLRLYVNRRARPVAWLVSGTRVVSRGEALRLVRGEVPGFDPAAEALVEQLVPALASAPAAVPGAAGSVDVTAYGDDEIRLAVTAPTPALLVTSELAYPGWSATVDGVGTELLKVNGAFRGLVVLPGAHEVVLAYRPRLAILGLVVSAGAALALLACLLAARVRARAPGRVASAA